MFREPNAEANATSIVGDSKPSLQTDKGMERGSSAFAGRLLYQGIAQHAPEYLAHI
jgi:hypothetical protein